MMKWLNFSGIREEYEDIEEFYVDLNYVSNYNYEDLVGFIDTYEK